MPDSPDAPDYKELYRKAFIALTKAEELIEQAAIIIRFTQQQCEDMYIGQPDGDDDGDDSDGDAFAEPTDFSGSEYGGERGELGEEEYSGIL
ncbi:hypothetical protein FACS1894191_0740 [Clostridia bacterium]|nr:hypothetical protein FACS1894191_0740 [Clostridia bacterium]